MNKRASFSVLICIYTKNNAEHLALALQSVIRQTVKPDEIVLVVDGPVPGPIHHVLETFASEPGIKAVWISKNVGHGNARRIGLEHCTSDLIAIMDADDISAPDRFEKQLKCFEDSGLSVVGGNIQEFVGTPDNVVGVRAVPAEDADIKAYLRRRCPFNHMSVMFRYSDVMKAGGYMDWFCNEDYYLWIRMYEAGLKFKNIPDNLVYVRTGEEMYRRRGGWRYFKSEKELQSYMRDQGIINTAAYVKNVLLRFVLQVIVPGKMRGFIYRNFARVNS